MTLTAVRTLLKRMFNSQNPAIQLPSLARSRSQNAFDSFAALFIFWVISASTGCTGATGTVNRNGNSNQSNSGSPATIIVAPTSIRFSSVAVGSSASQSVTVTNGGGSSLTVSQASTTASGGFSITGISLPMTLDAGKQANFNIVFSPKTAGTVSGGVSILSNASTTPTDVTVTGTGAAATLLLTSSTLSLSFGNVAVGSNKAMSATLTNAGNSNITVLSVSGSGGPFTASGVPAGLILMPGQTATLDLIFAPTAFGSFTGNATVTSDATDSRATISLSGAGVPAPSHSVALDWKASTSRVAGYNVYRAGLSGGPYAKITSSPVNTDAYTDADVLSGATYYYVVTSIASDGVESAYSGQVSVTIPTP